MPEGPEVKVVIKSLSPFINKRIVGIQQFVERPWVVSQYFPSVVGQKITDIKRIGKFIKFELETTNLVSHLSFTGSYQTCRDNFSSFMLLFSDSSRLFYSDKRGLGKLRVMTDDEIRADKTLRAHVCDGLEDSSEVIYNRLLYLKNRGVSKELKPFLLDFHYICGIGNIYGSEISYHAGLNPFRKFSSLTEEELQRLSVSISFILKRAYNLGGSSIESFSDLNNSPGRAQDYHQVYYKDVCTECGGRIVQTEQNKRSTFYCPNCQGG